MVWNALIRPHFEYVAPVLTYATQKNRDEIKRLFTTSFKKMLNLPRSLKNEYLPYFLGDLFEYGAWKREALLRMHSPTYFPTHNSL